MRQIINHFTDTDLYKFSMCCAIIDNFPRARVKYEFVDRNKLVYPKGFAELVTEQVAMLENVVITDEEINFIRRKCYYMPEWFLTYLRGFRYKREWVNVWQDDDRYLHIEIEGLWAETVLLEVQVLAIVSELYYIVTGQDKKFDYEAYYQKSYAKAVKMLSHGCVWADFGPRRRASFEAEEVALRAMLKASADHVGDDLAGRCIGTSDVYLAMKYDVTPIGTMAHEYISAIAAMYGPQMANHIAMSTWRNTYRGSLGTFLYDTFQWEAFERNLSEDFARGFAGLRVDSGDNYEQFSKIKLKYASFGIPVSEKQVIFSNALDVDSACELQERLGHEAKVSFGIGTCWTNDFDGVKPLNIVIKLIAAKITEKWPFYNDACKMSEDKGKTTGKPEVVKRYKEILHIED